MFNLLIARELNAWDSGTYEFLKSRVAVEYTANEISERYKDFSKESLEELKSLPALFVIENEKAPSQIGYINQIRIKENTISIDFEIDSNFSKLPIDTIENLSKELGLGEIELFRTHWAIKDERLFETLLKKGIITQKQIDASQKNRKQFFPLPKLNNNNVSQIFIVHGHNEVIKNQVAQFVSELGFQPIILQDQASGGQTIIEKIEQYSNVGFALILYTECDIGFKKGDLNGQYRARQNVVFEHGYLMAKLGRNKVTAIVKGEIERPNDISGIIYINMDKENKWKEAIKRELKNSDCIISK